MLPTLDSRDDNAIDNADLSALKNQLAAARLERKRADSDAQMLSNRLLLLKAETSKANRKIEETKSRTRFIMRVQRESEERQEKKLLLSQRKYAVDKETKTKCNTRKLYSDPQSGSDEARVMTAKKKQEEVKMIRDMRRANLNTIRQQKEEDRQKAIQSKLDIQMQHEAVRRRKEEEMRAKCLQVKRQVHSRIEREQIESQSRLQEIAAMEKQEADLLASLQKTQDMQRKAYDGLESALSASRGLGTPLEYRGEATPASSARSATAAPGMAKSGKSIKKKR